ncbi:hypothetical protein DH2020_034970 [Rehmannia glutinosa]|uniref:Uncharacterized protein n=1 Tax=Rehmannia glutinosa TaxID=99300 RepID=A0ABR0V9M4_REHGL
MSAAPSASRLNTPFLNCPLKLSSSFPSSRKSAKTSRSPGSYPCVRAVDLDQNTIVAITVGVVSVAVGIGIPVFYETQIDSAVERCRFCMGTGNVTVELGGDEKEVSRCINCDGNGSLTCTTCQGSGIQPRYLDRREFKDDD